MKVLTWNASKAGESQRKLWEMAQREDADIVLRPAGRTLGSRDILSHEATFLSPGRHPGSLV